MSTEMRILTVRQPWAYAIIHLGKDVENRTRNLAGDYRGPVAIHAGLGYDEDAGFWTEGGAPQWFAVDESGDHREPRGAIISVVDLIGVHEEHPYWSHTTCSCESDWAEIDVWHLVLANPRPLAVPISYRGALGLRRLPDDVVAQVLEGTQTNE